MPRYNPNKTPDRDQWLGMSEAKRIRMVEAYHHKHGGYGESIKFHSTIHAAIETQLAEGIEPVLNALDRLTRSELDRHDSIHAIGSVLAEYMWEMLNQDEPGDVNEEYFQRLSELTKESWCERHSGDA